MWNLNLLYVLANILICRCFILPSTVVLSSAYSNPTFRYILYHRSNTFVARSVNLWIKLRQEFSQHLSFNIFTYLLQHIQVWIFSYLTQLLYRDYSKSYNYRLIFVHSLHSKETFSPIAIKIQTRPVVGDLIHSDFVPTAWVPNGS